MITEAEINWHEVAEETAKNLGWNFQWKGRKSQEWGSGLGPMCDHENSFVDDCYVEHLMSAHKAWLAVPSHIFSWPTFGLIVEKAEEMGWCFMSNGKDFSFQRDKLCTNHFFYSEYGHIKAVCLAFNEIFKMEGE